MYKYFYANVHNNNILKSYYAINIVLAKTSTVSMEMMSQDWRLEPGCDLCGVSVPSAGCNNYQLDLVLNERDEFKCETNQSEFPCFVSGLWYFCKLLQYPPIIVLKNIHMLTSWRSKWGPNWQLSKKARLSLQFGCWSILFS